MGQDDQFILETVCPLNEIIQVHVPKFVYLLAAVAGSDEAQFCYQDFRAVYIGTSIEASRARIAGVRKYRRSNLRGDGHTRELQVPKLVARQAVIFWL